MEQSRCVCLAKTEHESADPKQYRVLTLTSTLYRRWASIRLGHMSKWASKWITPDMAGTSGGYSPDQASWLFSAQVEANWLKGGLSRALSVD
eukprot:15464368-Alexandrium_andersonii.AAC.1